MGALHTIELAELARAERLAAELLAEFLRPPAAITVSLGRYRDATRHLAPGIWAASGPGGVDVRPVLMFVKAHNYRPRLSMQAVIARSNLQEYLDRRVRYRVRNLAEGKLA